MHASTRTEHHKAREEITRDCSITYSEEMYLKHFDAELRDLDTYVLREELLLSQAVKQHDDGSQASGTVQQLSDNSI
jgi:hypothetical protein